MACKDKSDFRKLTMKEETKNEVLFDIHIKKIFCNYQKKKH